MQPSVPKVPRAALVALVILGGASPAYSDADTDSSDPGWIKVVEDRTRCDDVTLLQENGAKIWCSKKDGPAGSIIRVLKFSPGTYDLPRQVWVVANTEIVGAGDPHPDKNDKTVRPADMSKETVFHAVGGATDEESPYCLTDSARTRQLRKGFLMHSGTAVRDVHVLGGDKVRPKDNGSLCGGGIFETPSCVGPGWCHGSGDTSRAWGPTPDNPRGNIWRIDPKNWKKIGCTDQAGNKQDAATGDGRGVDGVLIENVRLNDHGRDIVALRGHNREVVKLNASQTAWYTGPTVDGSETTNVVIRHLSSWVTKADGINFHGNFGKATVEHCHIEHTGDDTYILWGAWYKNLHQHITFRDNVAVNPGGARIGDGNPYKFGHCFASFGVSGRLDILGNVCYDRPGGDWNDGQPNEACPTAMNCNSAMFIAHDESFGAIYTSEHRIRFSRDNQYKDMLDPDTDLDVARPGDSNWEGGCRQPLAAPQDEGGAGGTGVRCIYRSYTPRSTGPPEIADQIDAHEPRISYAELQRDTAGAENNIKAFADLNLGEDVTNSLWDLANALFVLLALSVVALCTVRIYRSSSRRGRRPAGAGIMELVSEALIQSRAISESCGVAGEEDKLLPT